ncbi:MAG: hypothetical protein NVS1B14_05680 [Vulcanimicrobiaceae bacterium]
MLDAARNLVRTARYNEAMQMLAGCEDWAKPYNERGVLLCAEVHLHRDALSVLEYLAQTQHLFATDPGRFAYFLIAGNAYANTRDFDGAAAMFHSARQLLKSPDPSRRWRLAYQEARLRWLRGEFDTHSTELELALEDPSPNAQLSALSLRSWMHAGLEHFEEQIADLCAALRFAQSHPEECDVARVGIGVHSLLRIAFELGNEQGVKLGEEIFSSLEWTPDIQVDRFQAIRALGWDAFLHGKSARAQWLFKDSKQLAPTMAWKVMAHLDRAYVARMNLNEIWATEELLQADRLAREVTWGATRGEERLALVTMAILFAPVDMAQAQRYVSEYIQMGTENVNPTLALLHNRRAVALEKYASGRVQQVLGHAQLAADQFEAAYTVFSETRHHYRAALAAQGLSEVTHSASWHDKAKKHAAQFPKSPLYERLHDTEGPAVGEAYAGLSNAQRQIALAICEGLEVPELSKRFSRSFSAITKQVDSVYAAFGVSTPHELRVELQGHL